MRSSQGIVKKNSVNKIKQVVGYNHYLYQGKKSLQNTRTVLGNSQTSPNSGICPISHIQNALDKHQNDPKDVLMLARRQPA